MPVGGSSVFLRLIHVVFTSNARTVVNHAVFDEGAILEAKR